MNFAFPAVLIFLIVLPGFLFRSRFKYAEQTSLDYSPFGRVVTEALLFALVLHLIGLAIAASLGRPLQTAGLLGLLSSSARLQEESVAAVAASAGSVLTYFVSIYAAAFVVPTLMRAAISKYRLDRSGTPLASVARFHEAPWYYLLTGADFERDAEPDYIIVAAIVEVADTAVLYTGILADFFFSPDGQLDRLILQDVSRRTLDRDKDTGGDERFYRIDGDYFVIRYAEAITLNVHYVKLWPADHLVDGST